MTNRSRVKAFLEGSAIAIVVAFPLAAIGWYLLGGNNASDTSAAPATTTQVTTQTTNQAPALQQAPASATATLAVDGLSALPSTVTAGEIVPFSFTITNSGNAVATFSYRVYVVWKSGGQDVIDVNHLSLEGGASKSIPEALKFETANAGAVVYIKILPSGPTTHFALPRI
jgi:hypothetical protein